MPIIAKERSPYAGFPILWPQSKYLLQLKASMSISVRFVAIRMEQTRLMFLRQSDHEGIIEHLVAEAAGSCYQFHIIFRFSNVKQSKQVPSKYWRMRYVLPTRRRPYTISNSGLPDLYSFSKFRTSGKRACCFTWLLNTLTAFAFSHFYVELRLFKPLSDTIEPYSTNCFVHQKKVEYFAYVVGAIVCKSGISPWPNQQ